MFTWEVGTRQGKADKKNRLGERMGGGGGQLGGGGYVWAKAE